MSTFKALRDVGVAACVAACLLALMASGAMSASASSSVTKTSFTDITWTVGAAIPHPHIEGAVAQVNGKIYAIAGATTDCSDNADICTATTGVDVYHPSSNTWTSAAPIPNPHRTTPTAVTIGGKIYVVGGQHVLGAQSNAVDVYAPKTNSWTTLPAASDLPASIDAAQTCGASVGSNIYIFGSEGIGVLDTSESNPSWTVLAASPLLKPSALCRATRVGPNDPTSKSAHVVITGPGDGTLNSFSQRVLVFSPASHSVRQAAAATAPMAEHSTVTLRRNVVIAGGDFSPSTVQLLPPGLGSAMHATDLPSPRDDAEGGVVVRGKFYIVGGVSEGGTPAEQTTPEVLIGTPN